MSQGPKSLKISLLEARDDSFANKDGQPAPRLDEPQTPVASDSNTSASVKDPSSPAWREALTCEARNSLQVVLSGAEILLENHFGNLEAQQKVLLTKVMDNAYHLCNLISLLGPEECKPEQMSTDEIVQIHRVMGRKV